MQHSTRTLRNMKRAGAILALGLMVATTVNAGVEPGTSAFWIIIAGLIAYTVLMLSLQMDWFRATMADVDNGAQQLIAHADAMIGAAQAETEYWKARSAGQ